MLLAFVLALAIPQTAATPSTPVDCTKAAREFLTARQKELAPLTAAKFAQAQDEKKAMAKACAAKISVQSLDAAGLVAMVELYGEAGETDKAMTTLQTALARPDLTPVARGSALLQAINAGLGEPKGDARNARLETLVDQLDAIGPTAFDSQWAAHSRMNSYYRGDDIDAGIIKHSSWLIGAAKKSTPDQLQKNGSTVAAAHVNMAEAWAGEGKTADALKLLHSGVAMVGSITPPRSTSTLKAAYFDAEIARLELVGLPATALTAPQWFNKPAQPTTAMIGKVTLLEFTAHWCGPCRESYPGLNRLRAKYGPQGFQVMLGTQLYGYFGSERDVPAAAELVKDKAYFAEHELSDVPVAIGNKAEIKLVNGVVTYVPEQDKNDVAYHVTGIPQIQIIDKKGKIRLIMVGYDDANETQLAKFIEQLLAEK